MFYHLFCISKMFAHQHDYYLIIHFSGQWHTCMNWDGIRAARIAINAPIISYSVYHQLYFKHIYSITSTIPKSRQRTNIPWNKPRCKMLDVSNESICSTYLTKEDAHRSTISLAIYLRLWMNILLCIYCIMFNQRKGKQYYIIDYGYVHV